MFTEWKPEFSVGEPILDADHRHLIELLNRLSDHVGPSCSKATIIDNLVQLYSSANEHFAREETIMQAHGYSNEYIKHYADHQRLLNEVILMIYEHQYGSANDNGASTEWIHNWFHEHHTTHDARLQLSIQEAHGT